MSSPTKQPSACVAIFEKQPYWGPELQRQLMNRRTLVRECRSVNDLIPSVVEFSAGVVLMVLDVAPTECLQWLATHLADYRNIPCLVIASAEFHELEWLIRETGGVFIDDEVDRSQLARLCLRYLK